jgi:hypothetical protein
VSAVHEGGCLCRAVRYRASGPASHATLCHCRSCRLASGAPVVAWVTFPSDSFAFVHGTPARHRSSASVVRTFCGACGSALTYQRDDLPAEVDVTTASLDHPEACPPSDHTWTSQRIGWLAVAGGLPQFPRSRTEAD